MNTKTIKNITRIISIVLILTTILGGFCMVFADIPTAKEPTSGAEDVNNIVGYVIWVIQVIAMAAAVIMLMFLGIRFVTASPEGKAEIKKSAVIYIVGAILLLAASGILQIVKNLADNVSGSN